MAPFHSYAKLVFLFPYYFFLLGERTLMRNLVRSKLALGFIALVALAAIAAVPLANSALTHFSAHAAAPSSFPAKGNLDCNGYSKIQQPLKSYNVCADFQGYDGSRGYDNGHYVGHDEPTIQDISSFPGSGNNVQW